MKLNLDQLRRAVKLQEEIEERQKELDQILGGQEGETASPQVRLGRPPSSLNKKVGQIGVRRTMSLEARNKIAAAQRARWAKYHAGK